MSSVMGEVEYNVSYGYGNSSCGNDGVYRSYSTGGVRGSTGGWVPWYPWGSGTAPSPWDTLPLAPPEDPIVPVPQEQIEEWVKKALELGRQPQIQPTPPEPPKKAPSIDVDEVPKIAPRRVIAD